MPSLCRRNPSTQRWRLAGSYKADQLPDRSSLWLSALVPALPQVGLPRGPVLRCPVLGSVAAVISTSELAASRPGEGKP